MIEILIEPEMSLKGVRMLQALADTAPVPCTVVDAPTGDAKTLMIYGVGDPRRKLIAEKHRASGGRLVLFDLGYFAKEIFVGAMRLSIDHWHPQKYLDRAPLDSSRWDALHIPLRNDYNPKGPIILVGLGPKTRAILDDKSWEQQTFQRLKKRFPKREIIFRPKPRRPHPHLPCKIDGKSPIEAVLKGASLVVVKHSNVALDACVAGIPFECEDGAARWLDGRAYSVENRLELLWRTQWFNWRAEEAEGAWKMIERCL